MPSHGRSNDGTGAIVLHDGANAKAKLAKAKVGTEVAAAIMALERKRPALMSALVDCVCTEDTAKTIARRYSIHPSVLSQFKTKPNMSKRIRTNGSRAIDRRLAEGRGQGRGADYKPWIEIHDLASRGQANRVKSPLHGRTCHLHSQLETDWFYTFHALPGLKDLREQYPLLELAETLAIADQIGIVHPTDPKSQQPCVATTDFLLTIQDGLREVDTAIAIKPAADLASQRVLEKLEIERVYWSARNITWRILTDKELPRSMVKNMKWLHPHIDLPGSGEFTPHMISRVRTVMEPEVKDSTRSLAVIASECDDRLGLTPGAALCVARHLISNGVWPVDLTVEIDPRKPLQLRAHGGPHVTASKLVA